MKMHDFCTANSFSRKSPTVKILNKVVNNKPQVIILVLPCLSFKMSSAFTQAEQHFVYERVSSLLIGCCQVRVGFGQLLTFCTLLTVLAYQNFNKRPLWKKIILFFLIQRLYRRRPMGIIGFSCILKSQFSHCAIAYFVVVLTPCTDLIIILFVKIII